MRPAIDPTVQRTSGVPASESTAKTAPWTGTLILGSVSQKDVIEARNREMMRRDAAGGFESSVGAVAKGQTVDLGDGYLIRELQVPAHLASKITEAAKEN